MGVVTLAELRQRVRELADMEDSSFVDDVELTGHINRACWALDDKLHTTWADYYATELEVTLSGNTHELPQDFYKLAGLDVPSSGGEWVSLKPYNLAERNHYRNSTSTDPACQRYRIQGTRTLRFLPGFKSPSNAILTYYPQQPALAEPTDSREYPHGWEQWACLMAAIVCLTKEERDTTALEKLWALEEKRVMDSAPVRDVVEPIRFSEVEGSRGGIAHWRR